LRPAAISLKEETTMGSTTFAAVGRLAGAILLACLLAAPQASTAAPPSESGLLARGAGYDSPHGSVRVRAVQLRLRAAGEAPGPIDGLFGPRTGRAVRHFQARAGLAVDGIVGHATKAALARRLARVEIRRPGPQPDQTGQNKPAVVKPIRRPTLATQRAVDTAADRVATLVAAGFALLSGILTLTLVWGTRQRRVRAAPSAPDRGAPERERELHA
jgi:peptidoglycan hydrolase-like protein with peptidoglycan-binding domain